MSNLLDIYKAKYSNDYDALNEASLNRIASHVANAGQKPIAILTSWRAGNTKRANVSKLKELQLAVKSMGKGFIKLVGHWLECQNDDVEYSNCPQEDLIDSKEPALMVIGLYKRDAIKLGNKYQQDAIVYAGPETKGKVQLIFKGGDTMNIGSFHPNKIQQAFSQYRGKPFAFEYVSQTWSEKIIEESYKRTIF